MKRLPVWIEAAFHALETKTNAKAIEDKANVELQIGAAFPLATCPSVRKADILDHIAAAWIACGPFLKMLGLNPGAPGTEGT